MSNPIDRQEFSYDIYGGIDAELDAILAQNQASQADRVKQIAASALASSVREVTSSFGEVSTGFGEVIHTAFSDASKLFETVDIEVEVPTDFAEINWKRVNEVYDRMTRVNLRPQLVVAPNGLSKYTWERLFSPVTLVASTPAEDLLQFDVGWGIHIVSANPRPAVVQISHNGKYVRSEYQKQLDPLIPREWYDDVRELYPTASAYLTMQLLRRMHGDEFVDGKLSSHIQNPGRDVQIGICARFVDGKPRPGKGAGNDQISLFTVEAAIAGSGYGLRPAFNGASL